MYGHNGPPADIGLPFTARHPRDPDEVLGLQLMGRFPEHRTRIRKGRHQRLRLKSGKRVMDPGPADKGTYKSQAKMLKQLGKRLRAKHDETVVTVGNGVIKAAEIGPALYPKPKRDPKTPAKYEPTNIRGQLAMRSSPAKRAKLRARR